MFLWEFLKPGDHVALLAPGALPVSPNPDLSLIQATDLSWKLLDELIEGYAQNGLQASFWGDLCPDQSYCGYYSASLEVRAAAMENALSSPVVKALLLIRGGFGAKQLIHFWTSQGRHPFQHAFPKKPLVGFSDNTSLLSLAQTASHGAIHGPVGLRSSVLERRLTVSAQGIRLTAGLLKGETPEVVSQWTLLTAGPVSDQPLQGEIRGGNASVLQRSISTSYGLRGESVFIFLEDVEDPKRFLDVFLHLVEAQGLGTPQRPARALLLGYLSFIARAAPSQREALLTQTVQVLQACLERQGFTGMPIFYNPHYGHGDRNDSLPLGTQACLLSKDGKNIWQLVVSVNQSQTPPRLSLR